MSLDYQIAFPQNAPDLEPLVRQLAAEWIPSIKVSKTENRLVVRQDDELLLSVSFTNKSNYHELSFGEYHYQRYWFIRFGKADTMESLRFCLELLNKTARNFSGDFLALFNGELILLKREAGHLYLNSESGVWEQPEHLVIFQGLEHSFVAYPINY